MKKKPAKAPEAVGIVEAPESAAGPAPMDVEPIRTPEVAGRAASPEMLREENTEADIIDLPSLTQAYKRADIGWSMSREQILRTTEAKFCTAHLDEYQRASSVLVGLPRTLVIYDRENPGHNPAVPIWDNAAGLSSVTLSKSLAKFLRHKDQQLSLIHI